MPGPETQKTNLPFNNLFLNSGAVNGSNQWWMYVVGIMATVMGYTIFQFIMLYPLIKMAQSRGISETAIFSDPNMLFNPAITGINKNIMLALDCGMFVFALLALMTVIVLIHKKTLLSVITAYEKFRWKRFFFAFGVWAALVGVSLLAEYFISPQEYTLQFKPLDFIMLLLVTVILLPIQTGTEEIFFRGYLMQGLAMVSRNGIVPLLITSFLFGIVHAKNPESEAHGLAIMLPYYCLFAFFLGLLTLIDEGLELAMGIHCANNVVTCLLITSPNTVLKTDAIFMVSGEDPAAELITWSVFATITFIIFWLKYRWKNFNLILR